MIFLELYYQTNNYKNVLRYCLVVNPIYLVTWKKSKIRVTPGDRELAMLRDDGASINWITQSHAGFMS